MTFEPQPSMRSTALRTPSLGPSTCFSKAMPEDPRPPALTALELRARQPPLGHQQHAGHFPALQPRQAMRSPFLHTYTYRVSILPDMYTYIE
eukprot:135358-Chlamydomonas_euryale.AAC.1